MANPFKGAMSFFGLSSAEEEDQDLAEYDQKQGEGDSTFDEDANVAPGPAFTSREGSSSSLLSPSPSPRSRMNRITTIHPKTYEEAQLVGRALRDGVPVVLNLTGVPEAVAYRIVDFSAGVVFGVRGSIERVTPRVFLLSPAQVNIKVEEVAQDNGTAGLFD
ncbi:hypothetical protein HMPREF0620_1242 [Parascardovia denticolens DSM 10105 = JCM 12538]|uniref:Cell division protein SepF n=1 Tax=Parascardovia denticolens DSM 10105 = JCM 12538 TaxID=864564 RepID=E6K0N4_PARDN|nr:cell division protein SepF [Parascardovia denticolens]EFG32448.1 hypothetical protein HMPREF9017_01350 [Parascardovia denticolens F0305]EFT84237.1 hypothetical protein HMPREF0620_1242 [Parascardovia denticolens DSM 10105 = JCM 12538]BAR04946.1 conserved hypothetical protein [Parascardovia denticolens DSM 10105 = JCM 12538]